MGWVTLAEQSNKKELQGCFISGMIMFWGTRDRLKLTGLLLEHTAGLTLGWKGGGHRVYYWCSELIPVR